MRPYNNLGTKQTSRAHKSPLKGNTPVRSKLVDKDEPNSRWLGSSLFTSGGKQEQYKHPHKTIKERRPEMEVSRLTVSDELRHQKSTKTNILLWMQQHPRQCNNTNIARLSRTITIPSVTYDMKRIALNSMVQNQVLTRFGTKFNSRFIINYLHKDIPEEVLANAPENERKEIERIKAQVLKENKKLTAEGVIVTPAPEKEKQNDKETKENKDKNMDTTSPQVQTKVTKKAKQITITVNIKQED